MFINKTSAIAKANREVVYSNVYTSIRYWYSLTILYSPLSLLSVPSMSKIKMLPIGFLDIQIPLVVCILPFWESRVSNCESNNKFSKVPKISLNNEMIVLFPEDWHPIIATVL